MQIPQRNWKKIITPLHHGKLDTKGKCADVLTIQSRAGLYHLSTNIV